MLAWQVCVCEFFLFQLMAKVTDFDVINAMVFFG